MASFLFIDMYISYIFAYRIHSVRFCVFKFCINTYKSAVYWWQYIHAHIESFFGRKFSYMYIVCVWSLHIVKKHNVTVAIISYLTRMLMEFQNVLNYTHKTFYKWSYIFASHCTFISWYRTKSIVKFASGNFPFFWFASEIKVRIFFSHLPF